MDWDNDAVKAAAAYLLELIDAGAADERTRTVYAGLLDVLDPVRSASRIGQAVAADAALAIAQAAGIDRRSSVARRLHADRRAAAAGPLDDDRRSRPRRVLQDRRGY